jgi:hypothetical protein
LIIFQKYAGKKFKVKKFKFNYNIVRIMGSLHKDKYKFFTISRSILLIMRNVLDKYRRESKNRHFIYNDFLFKFFYLWDRTEKYCRAGRGRDFNKSWIFWTDFLKILKFRNSWKFVQWQPVCFMRTDGQKDRQTRRR